MCVIEDEIYGYQLLLKESEVATFPQKETFNFDRKQLAISLSRYFEINNLTVPQHHQILNLARDTVYAVINQKETVSKETLEKVFIFLMKKGELNL